MTTQTEKLREKIDAILKAKELFVNAPEDLAPFIDQSAIEKSCSDQILKACKEAGLTFTDHSTDDKGNIILQGLEEIEV